MDMGLDGAGFPSEECAVRSRQIHQGIMLKEVVQSVKNYPKKEEVKERTVMKKKDMKCKISPHQSVSQWVYLAHFKPMPITEKGAEVGVRAKTGKGTALMKMYPFLEKSFSNPAYDPNASSVCGAEGGVQVHSMEDYIEPVKSRVEDLYYEGYLMSKKRVYGEDMYEKEEPNFFNRIYNALSVLDPRQNDTSNSQIYTGGARPKSKSKINVV